MLTPSGHLVDNFVCYSFLNTPEKKMHGLVGVNQTFLFAFFTLFCQGLLYKPETLRSNYACTRMPMRGYSYVVA